jgi:general secretion pathway protein N
VTRVRLGLGRGLFFLGAFLFALVALLPLRVGAGWIGLSSHGFAAREAEGSVWLGVLRDAEFRSVPVGDLGARLEKWPLLLLRARVAVKRGGASPLGGALALTRHGFAIDDARGRVDVSRLFAPLPIAALDLDEMSVRFASGACDRADGLVRASLAGRAFSGTARCEGKALLLPLVGASGLERMAIRVTSDGRFDAALAAPGAPPLRASGSF